MHVPDGFLNGNTLAVAAGLSACALAASGLHLQRTLPRRQVPLLGLAGAFVFAAQMLNFPIAGGTSGHLIGGVLTAVLLGPSAGIFVITCVLIVQCLVFGDGGLLALGANILNMGVIDSIGGYLVYRAVRAIAHRLAGDRTAGLTGVALGSWAGAVIASAVCAGELAASGAVSARVGFPAMVGVHALIGIGEAILTTLIIAAVWKARPELQAGVIPSQPAARWRPAGLFCAYGLLIALALAIFVSPFASTAPDGLDRVAADHGFSGREQRARAIPAPANDYKIPFISSESMSTRVAGVAGILVVFGIAVGASLALSRRAPAADDFAQPAPTP